MMFWTNFIGYQTVWFLAVIGASHGNAWPGVCGAIVFVSSQVLLAQRPTVELRLLLVAVGFGLVVDGVLAASGWARYSAADVALPPGGAPVWILALWASFAMTLNQTLAYLRERPWLALVFGAIGGPVAYYGAARTWPAIVFETPQWHALAWLSVGWAIAMPTLAMLARKWMSPPSENTAAFPLGAP